jgi:hypothetical protein
MASLHIHPARFAAFNINISRWLRVGATVMLSAACLIVFGTRLQEQPILVTAVGEPTGSVADSYVEVRHRVEVTLPALRVTNDAAEILGREAAIGTAVKAMHVRAAQGEVFTQAVTEKVHAAMRADLTRRSASDRANLMRDVPTMTPRVNEPYPMSEALATFPPLLLQSLPRLPDDLEYRFMGRHLVIRDGRTNLIVDYLPDAMTSATGVSH